MPSASQYGSWAILIAMIVIFYFILIAPQRKQQKKDAAMRSSITTGDRVCTIGGIIGRVVAVTDETFTLETSSNHTRMKMYKWAIREKITADDKPVEDQEKKPLFGRKKKSDDDK